MSKTTVIHPIIACLNAVCDVLKTKDDWSTVNNLQKTLVEKYYSKSIKDLSKLNDIIDAMFSIDNKDLMEFFKERGFQVVIEPFGDGEFGVGSVLSVLIEWLTEHSKSSIFVGDKEYPAVLVESHYEVFKSENHKHPVVMLKTKSGEEVYLTIADKLYENLDLISRIKDIQLTLNNVTQDYENVILPMVNLDQDVDISWVNGINIHGRYISKAIQKTRFKMNHVGAKVESMAFLTNECCMRNKFPVVINKPFFVWVNRCNVNEPLFVGYITEEDWKDPGDFHEKK